MNYEQAEVQILNETTKESILGIPGVIEIVTEYLTNDIIDRMNQDN